MSNKIIVALFRSFLRVLRLKNKGVLLQPLPRRQDVQHTRYFSQQDDKYDIIKLFCPHITILECWHISSLFLPTVADCSNLIKYLMRIPVANSIRPYCIDHGFSVYRCLPTLLSLMSSTSITETKYNDSHVQVICAATQSESQNIFVYKLTLHNFGTTPIWIIDRHIRFGTASALDISSSKHPRIIPKKSTGKYPKIETNCSMEFTHYVSLQNNVSLIKSFVNE